MTQASDHAMANGMFIAATGAAVQSRRMEVLSHNIANVDTAGFKPQMLTAQSEPTLANSRSPRYGGKTGFAELGSGVYVADTPTSYAQGAVNSTGRDLDFAINGEGFFMVQRNGQQFLTRAGNFELSSTGQLTNDHGDPVLDSSGGPVAIDPNAEWSLSSNGSIEQAGGLIELALVKPQSPGDLAKAGTNLFLPLADVVPVEQRSVQQRSLETSGMSPVAGMMEMISASRAFEANIQMIQNQDHISGTLINRVLSSGNG